MANPLSLVARTFWGTFKVPFSLFTDREGLMSGGIDVFKDSIVELGFIRAPEKMLDGLAAAYYHGHGFEVDGERSGEIAGSALLYGGGPALAVHQICSGNYLAPGLYVAANVIYEGARLVNYLRRDDDSEGVDSE